MGRTLFNLSSGGIIGNASASQSALSLQDAFSFYEYSPELGIDGVGLSPDACNITGLQNCTASCLNQSSLFGSLESLHNCLLYPAVAQLYVNGRFGDAHLADSLGIDNKSHATQTANNITTIISSCLSDYCGVDKRCTENLPPSSGFFIDNSTLSMPDSIYYSFYYDQPSIFQFDICEFVTPSSYLNADIGGIGVSTKLT